VIRLLAAALVCGACSSHGTPAHPTPGRDAAVASTEPGPSDAECDGLFDHVIALRSTGDTRITDDDRVKLRGELRDRSLHRCRAMPRGVYTCAVAAPTLEVFTACDSTQP
jgi:hypothetical protein